MLKYTAFKLSVNTMHPTLTQALIALSLLKSYILVFVPASYNVALSIAEIHFGARRGVELMIFIALNYVIHSNVRTIRVLLPPVPAQ